MITAYVDTVCNVALDLLHPNIAPPLSNLLTRFQDAMTRQELRNHEVADILVSPVRQVARDAGNERYIKDAPDFQCQPRYL